MTNVIRIDRGIPTEMRDGALLRADIYRPDDGGKHPAILIRSPYDPLSVLDWCFLPVYEAAKSGYAVAIQNLRGTFASEGQNNLGDITMVSEGRDGYDTVEWLAGQKWCDGNVGTAGGSYMGLNQWITAREKPPHLRAISPWVSGSGGTEPSRHNGIVNLGVALNWILGRAIEIAEKQEKAGQDISRIKPLLDQAAAEPGLVYNYLPLKDCPHFDFPGIRELWTSRVLNTTQETREYIEKTRTPYEKVEVPCLHISGWFDFYPSGTLSHFQNMRENGGSELARRSQHILMGPWDHLGPTHAGDTGDLGFGRWASIRGSGLGAHVLAFFDRYLRGLEVALPAVRYFTMGRNIWREADNWPPSGTHWQRFFLHSQGHANSSAGDGSLSRQEPGAESHDQFTYDPHSPAPTTGCRGHSQLLTFAPSPQEQSSFERRNDVLCYSTSVLDKDLEVTGPLKLNLFASTSAKDTDFTAKLVDVHPDGRAYNVVCDGIVRARYRKSLFAPEPVVPGEVNQYVIDLEAVSQLFRKGHRVRLDISSSSFPEYDRNMNTGNGVGEDARGIKALQTIYHSRGYASYIDLPTIQSSE